jgi:hypothetical protein
VTFRPSVLPDRDNDILSTFVRSFERARQLRRADQADARASAEFTARQEDREAQKQDRILQTNLEVASRPELQFQRGFEINQQLPGTRAQVTAETPGGGRQAIAEALGPDLQTTREVEGELVGRGPGGREIFRSEEAGIQGRQEEQRRDLEFQRELDEPARLEQADADRQERGDLERALRAAGVAEEEIRVLVRNPQAARQRLQSISAQSGRDTAAEAVRETPTTTGGERTRAARIDDIMQQAEDVNKPISEAQAGIFEDNPDQFEDFLRPIPQARQEAIQDDLDRMQDRIDDIEADELSSEEKLTAKKRALIDGGYMGPAEAFSVGLARFQDARREAREMAGTFLQPVSRTAQPGAGPAEASGLGGNQPRQSITSAEIPGFAAEIEDLNFADRTAELDRVFPGITAADRAAIMRAAGPAPVISGQPGSRVGDEPER